MKLLCGRDPDLMAKLHPAPCCLLLVQMAVSNTGGWGVGWRGRFSEKNWNNMATWKWKRVCASYRNQVIALLELFIVCI